VGPCPRVIGWVLRCATGETSRGVSGRERGSLPLKGVHPSSSSHALLLSNSPCPFAFKVSPLRCRSLPWPCKLIPSVPKLSGCSTWCAACLDVMHRRLAEGFVPAPSSASLPPESSCSLSSTSPAGWCCRSCLSSAGGARPRGGSALPPVLSFKDVHQPCGGGERAGLRLRLPHELVTHLFLQHSGERMIISLVEVGGEPWLCDTGQTTSAACCRASNSMAWMVLSSPP
jgi:hypothetical protein